MNINKIGDLSNLNSNISTFNISKSENKINEFEKVLSEANKNLDDEELRGACEEFETYFIQTMYKEMLKTVNDEKSFIKKNQGERIFTDMLNEERAKESVKGGGIGLADMMYAQMKREQIAGDSPINN